MATATPTKKDLLDAIRSVAERLGKVPSRSEFTAAAGISEYFITKHFDSWNHAVSHAELVPNTANAKLGDSQLLEDWANLVRKNRQIPTMHRYRREGTYSPSAFAKHFGPWSGLPAKFREYAHDKPQWADVLVLLPMSAPQIATTAVSVANTVFPTDTFTATSGPRYEQLADRPTYGNPIDFRGLRHEPVNEQGVVFLFGMLAKELGYMVEAVQTGYPDCEAKRQIGPNKWQRVRIEFEFESRNFRDHGHEIDGCDVIVCWRHNWLDCPTNLEVVELCTVIKSLSQSED